jgi:excisionase family DNA binding protein
MSPFLTTSQAARFIGLSTQTVVALAKSGKLPASFVSRRWKFRAQDIESYVASQRRSS